MKEFDNIDNYLLGMLSEKEEQAFLQEVAQDEELAQQLAQRERLISGIRHGGRGELKAELEGYHQKLNLQPAPPSKTLTRRLLPWIAAAASILLLLWAWQSWSPPQTPNHYAQYYSPYDFPAALRQGEAQLADEAFQNYEAGQYAAALPLFESALEHQPDQPILEMALAFCQLETGQMAAAQARFEKIYLAKTPLLEEQAAWYLALLALRADDPQQAQQYLKPLAVNPQADHHQEAQALLQQLD